MFFSFFLCVKDKNSGRLYFLTLSFIAKERERKKSFSRFHFLFCFTKRRKIISFFCGDIPFFTFTIHSFDLLFFSLYWANNNNKMKSILKISSFQSLCIHFLFSGFAFGIFSGLSLTIPLTRTATKKTTHSI